MNPLWLAAYARQATQTLQVAQVLAPTAEIWIGETSAAWHSGQCGVTDRFYSSFWYAYAMGSMSRAGISVFARHAFNGGCYRLVDPLTYETNPDFWLAKLFSNLMGTNALDVAVLDAEVCINIVREGLKTKEKNKGERGRKGEREEEREREPTETGHKRTLRRLSLTQHSGS